VYFIVAKMYQQYTHTFHNVGVFVWKFCIVQLDESRHLIMR